MASYYTETRAVGPYKGYPNPYHRTHGGSPGYPNGMTARPFKSGTQPTAKPAILGGHPILLVNYPA
jgi:hypothetical protein